MGAFPYLFNKKFVSETCACNRTEDYGVQSRATMRFRKVMEAAEEVLSSKLKASSHAPREYSNFHLGWGWALGGFIDREEGCFNTRPGGWRWAITLQSAGPWRVDGSRACLVGRISGCDWTTAQRCRRRG